MKEMKVLLVDDEQKFVEALSERLQMRDMENETAHNGEEALSLVDVKEPDVMVLDLKMPGIDGLETFKAIIAFRPDQKAIITSGYAETERVEQALQLGAGPFLKKPYTLETLGMSILEGLRQ